MKKFFCVIPLQPAGQLFSYHYQAVGNDQLRLDDGAEISFPILAAVNGFVEAGEEIRVIAVMSDIPECHYNRDILRQELADICDKKGAACPRGVETLLIANDDCVAAQVSTFQRLLDYVEEDDELFACMTYGTKPLSEALMMAVKYAYRVKRNTSISCVVYGKIDRHNSRNKEDHTAQVYDMTALIQLDEIVRILANGKSQIPNPL